MYRTELNGVTVGGFGSKCSIDVLSFTTLVSTGQFSQQMVFMRAELR